MYDYTINEMPLVFAHNVRIVKDFLSACGLNYEDMEYYVGLFDEQENMIAGGGFADNIIKCIAVAPSHRDDGLAPIILTHLRSRIFAKGNPNIFVFTKREYETIFSSMAFYTVGYSPKCVLLESSVNGISRYCADLAHLVGDGVNGCIVCNCNPCTNGHLYLIERASADVDNLYVILLADDSQYFNYTARHTMLTGAVAHLPNVTVLHGGSYIISRATFPSYFIKDASEVARNHIYLDLDIFARHIAPSLNITKRYVGTEKRDPATQQYNEIMKNTLPNVGIQVIEMERLEQGGTVVSASRVRELLKEGRIEQVASLVPPATFDYLLQKYRK